MKKTLLVGGLFLCISLASARLVEMWSYEKMTEAADLIVIGEPTAVEVTEERTKLLNTVEVQGLETTFAVLAVLKGEKGNKQVVLHHYQEAEERGIRINGPMLISFRPAEGKKYLLFLKREADGRFASITGQSDPADGVKDLGQLPITFR